MFNIEVLFLQFVVIYVKLEEHHKEIRAKGDFKSFINNDDLQGTALLTVDQRRWHDLKARLKMAQPLHVPPKPAESAKLRTRLYEITLSKWFKQVRCFSYDSLIRELISDDKIKLFSTYFLTFDM